MRRHAPHSTLELLLRFPIILWAESDRRISWGLAALFGGTGVAMAVSSRGVGVLSGVFLAVGIVGLVNGFRRPQAPNVTKAALADASTLAQRAGIPFDFCFGCRGVIPERPCQACDRETEIFQVTSETDRRLLVNRLALEGER